MLTTPKPSKRNLVYFFIPFLILLVSALIRIPNLSKLPNGFFTDEAALGYNAWSILKTGKDEWGEFLPLTLRSFHDHKPAIYAYLTIPFVAVLGLTETAVRLPAAIFGSILPVVVYWWLLSINESKNSSLKFTNILPALLTALVITFAPWHWEISRTAIEAGAAVCFTMIILLLLRSKKKLALLAALLLSVVTLYTYHTSRLLLPPILFLGAIWDQLKHKKIIIIFSGLLLAFGLFLSLTGSSERFRQISIFQDRGALALREEAIREDGGIGQTPLLATRAYHNKLVSYMYSFAEGYVTNTSLHYLFVGGAQPPRVQIPETGQFLLLLLPFFLIGLGKMAASLSNDKFQRWLLAWLLIAPIPASITYAELPHAYRTLFMLIPVSVVIAQGLITAYNLILQALPKYQQLTAGLVMLGTAAGLTWNAGKAWHQYALHQQVHQPWHRTSGYKELVSYCNQLPDKQDRRIVITRSYMEPYIFFLFYNQVDPERYQALEQKRLSRAELDVEKITEWSMFGLTFSTEKCPHDSYSEAKKDSVFFSHLECRKPLGYKRIGSIDFADGTPMFHIDVPMTKQEFQEYLEDHPKVRQSL